MTKSRKQLVEEIERLEKLVLILRAKLDLARGGAPQMPMAIGEPSDGVQGGGTTIRTQSIKFVKIT